MLRFMPLGLALACAVHAMDPMMQMQQHQQQMMMMNMMQNVPDAGPVKMRVYLKDGSKTPPLDSFRLSQGKVLLWRYEEEEAVKLKGKKIEYGPEQIDSIVIDKGFKGLPFRNRMVFLNKPGAIEYFSTGYMDSSDAMPYLIRKDGGELLRPRAAVIQDMVAGDPEAKDLIDRYAQRWYWRAGIMGVGAGLVGAGLGIAVATEEKDADGKRKPTTPVAGIMVLAGLVAVVVPVTPILNFIWNPLPKQALDTYNQNAKTGAVPPTP